MREIDPAGRSVEAASMTGIRAAIEPFDTGGMCHLCERLWAALGAPGVHFVGEGTLARSLGFSGRNQFYRWLGKHGYPRFRVLKDWATLLQLVPRQERHLIPLVRLAWRDGVEPSVYYRMVHRTAGCGWQEIQAFGSAHWVAAFKTSVLASAVCVRC